MIYLVTDRYEQVSKNGPFEPFIYLKTNILPRQAQDKHRESTQKKDRFSSGRTEGERLARGACADGKHTLPCSFPSFCLAADSRFVVLLARQYG